MSVLDGRDRLQLPGLSYLPRFISAHEAEALDAFFGALKPIWEQRHTADNHGRGGQRSRRLTRPVYWLGAWQFASLGYYAEPHHRQGRCLTGEPFPTIIASILERLRPCLADHQPSEVPAPTPPLPGDWRGMDDAPRAAPGAPTTVAAETRPLGDDGAAETRPLGDDGAAETRPLGDHARLPEPPNTCLINYYGSELGDGPPIDQARLRMHRDGEPGPVVMFCLGQPGLLEFVDASRPASAELAIWTRHRSVVVFSGPRFKDHLYHRIVQVRHGTAPQLTNPVSDFSLRRVSVSFRHVPQALVSDFKDLPERSRDQVRPYVRQLARTSEHYRLQLAQSPGAAHRQAHRR